MHGDDSPQMMLFAELPIPPDAAEQHLRRSRMCVPWRLAVLVLREIGRRRRKPGPDPEQLPLRIVLRDLDRDDLPEPPPLRRCLAAADAPPVETRGVASIFALADAVKAAKALRTRGRFGDAAGFLPSAPSPTVIREGGVVRVVGAQYPNNRWDDARIEKEQARRARQRPPKPTKGAKRKSKKLLDTIGSNVWDD